NLRQLRMCYSGDGTLMRPLRLPDYWSRAEQGGKIYCCADCARNAGTNHRRRSRIPLLSAPFSSRRGFCERSRFSLHKRALKRTSHPVKGVVALTTKRRIKKMNREKAIRDEEDQREELLVGEIMKLISERL